MTASIFISYRRNDSAYASSAIHDRLAAHFGRDSVFRDVEAISAGATFPQLITQAVQRSSVCLAVIGDTWLAPDQTGMRRIDHPDDWVRLEIETAFAESKPVIPVLVGNAPMPRPDDLPDSLRQLCLLNAVEIRAGRDFAGNIDRLIHAIEHFIASSGQSNAILTEDIRAAPPPEALDSTAESQGPKDPRKSVFISYRREGGAETARLMRYELLAREWRVFLDVEDLKAGQFDEELLSEVANADNFLLILSPNALANCTQENDWLRREIEHAIETQRNIVPLLKEDARRPDKEELPREIEPLKRFNCVDYSHVYYDATITRLLSFLTPNKA